MHVSFRVFAASAAIALAGVAFSATAAPAQAAKTEAPAAHKLSTQQQRMVNCNKEATGKKGAERKAFMSSCLKGEHAAAAPAAMAPAAPAATPAAAAATAPAAKVTQRERMKTCNADAKTKALKGADRKAFMSTCLKGEAAPAGK